MTKKLTQKTKEAVIAMGHLPRRDVAKRTGISLGSVQRILDERKSSKATKAKKTPAPPPARPEPSLSDGDEGDDIARSKRALRRAAELALQDRDVARMVSVERAIANLAALEARLAPPPPVDPNAQPDMQAAAQSFRERIGTMLDRIIADATRTA